jgi:hypothetical protein
MKKGKISVGTYDCENANKFGTVTATSDTTASIYIGQINKNKLRVFSPQANYINRATAACKRS